MVHSVELVFDADTEASVRHLWRQLHDAGLPSQNPVGRPHTTLVVAQRISPEVDAALRALHHVFPLPCRLGGVLIFGNIVTRLVVPSPELLELQAHVRQACLPHLTASPLPHTEAGQWTPHVTLARRVPPAQLATAVTLAAQPAEIVGTATGLRRWDGDNRVEHLID